MLLCRVRHPAETGEVIPSPIAENMRQGDFSADAGSAVPDLHSIAPEHNPGCRFPDLSSWILLPVSWTREID